MYVGLHVQRDNVGRMVYICESKESDGVTLLVARNYPFGREYSMVPIWIIPDMPAFKSNVAAEEWLRKHTSLF